jgi:hypothetical protein
VLVQVTKPLDLACWVHAGPVACWRCQCGCAMEDGQLASGATTVGMGRESGGHRWFRLGGEGRREWPRSAARTVGQTPWPTRGDDMEEAR